VLFAAPPLIGFVDPGPGPSPSVRPAGGDGRRSPLRAILVGRPRRSANCPALGAAVLGFAVIDPALGHRTPCLPLSCWPPGRGVFGAVLVAPGRVGLGPPTGMAEAIAVPARRHLVHLSPGCAGWSESGEPGGGAFPRTFWPRPGGRPGHPCSGCLAAVLSPASSAPPPGGVLVCARPGGGWFGPLVAHWGGRSPAPLPSASLWSAEAALCSPAAVPVPGAALRCRPVGFRALLVGGRYRRALLVLGPRPGFVTPGMAGPTRWVPCARCERCQDAPVLATGAARTLPGGGVGVGCWWNSGTRPLAVGRLLPGSTGRPTAPVPVVITRSAPRPPGGGNRLSAGGVQRPVCLPGRLWPCPTRRKVCDEAGSPGFPQRLVTSRGLSVAPPAHRF